MAGADAPDSTTMVAGELLSGPEEFVKRFGGSTVIDRVLICNNGIAVSVPQLTTQGTSHCICTLPMAHTHRSSFSLE